MNKKAIIFTIDGVRSDALLLANTPFLKQKIKEGTSGFSGKCLMPSITVPNHASLFRSRSPESHKIIDNYDLAPQEENTLSLFDIMFDNNKQCAAIISYLPLANAYGHCEKLNYLVHKNISLGLKHKIPNNYSALVEEHLLQGAALIKKNNVALTHVYIEMPDIVGHQCGWMSKEYIKAIENSDILIQNFIRSLGSSASEYAFFVTTDHGGHNKEHGSDSIEDTTIWFIAFGAGIKHTTVPHFSILDIMPSISKYLNIAQESHWEGIPLDILQ